MNNKFKSLMGTCVSCKFCVITEFQLTRNQLLNYTSYHKPNTITEHTLEKAQRAYKMIFGNTYLYCIKQHGYMCWLQKHNTSHTQKVERASTPLIDGDRVYMAGCEPSTKLESGYDEEVEHYLRKHNLVRTNIKVELAVTNHNMPELELYSQENYNRGVEKIYNNNKIVYMDYLYTNNNTLNV